MELTIVPVGHVESDILKSLARYLNGLGFSVLIVEELPIPRRAYNRVRSQYEVHPFIELADDSEGYHLLVTDVDLYVSHLNFIFGYGPGSNAVISISRLKGDLLEERTIKEAVHELGHVFSLEHCDNPQCVMHFSNCLADTDCKQKEFCPRCQELWDKYRR